MLTKIDLCTMALLKLGEEPIQSWTENSAAAQLSRTLFELTMDSLIASHPWRFACKTFDLVRDSDGEFIIPSECLRVVKCSAQICGNKIISDAQKIKIMALVRTPVEKFPSYFVSLAATKLAMEFCIPLSGDQTVFRMLTAMYESELQSAKFIDSTISVGTDITNFSLIDSRF